MSHNKITTLLLGLLYCLLLATVAHGSETSEVTSASELVVEFGESFTYELEASNESLGFSVLNLPYWIERKENKLEGNAIKLGTHKLTIYALNASGTSEPKFLKIIVKEQVEEN